MENGQPPSWRPDVDQCRAEACRGTVRDALGGLRNVEQLLASLRVGPRALSSVLPDVRSSCPAFGDAIDGLVTLIVGKLGESQSVASELRVFARTRLDTLANVIGSIEQQNLNARNRLRLEETISGVSRDLEAIVDLVELMGEVAWGRTMALDPSEVAREAFRSGEPPAMPLPATRLSLVSHRGTDEHVASPRALVLMLQHLVRWTASLHPNGYPVVTIALNDAKEVELAISLEGSARGETRWAPGRRLLPPSEETLRIAASAMRLRLDMLRDSATVRLVFPPSSPFSPPSL